MIIIIIQRSKQSEFLLGWPGEKQNGLLISTWLIDFLTTLLPASPTPPPLTTPLPLLHHPSQGAHARMAANLPRSFSEVSARAKLRTYQSVRHVKHEFCPSGAIARAFVTLRFPTGRRDGRLPCCQRHQSGRAGPPQLTTLASYVRRPRTSITEDWQLTPMSRLTRTQINQCGLVNPVFFLGVGWGGDCPTFLGFVHNTPLLWHILSPIVGRSCRPQVYDFCRAKHVFVVTKVILSRQAYFCRENKQTNKKRVVVFLATITCLSQSIATKMVLVAVPINDSHRALVSPA